MVHNTIIYSTLDGEEKETLKAHAFDDEFGGDYPYGSLPDEFMRLEHDLAGAKLNKWDDDRDNALPEDAQPTELGGFTDLLYYAFKKIVLCRAFGDTQGIWSPFNPGDESPSKGNEIRATSASTLEAQFDFQKAIEDEVCEAGWKVIMDPLSSENVNATIEENYEKVKEHMQKETFRKLVQKRLETAHFLLEKMEVQAIETEADAAYWDLLEIASTNPEEDPRLSVDDVIDIHYQNVSGRVTKKAFSELVDKRFELGSVVNQYMKVGSD